MESQDLSTISNVIFSDITSIIHNQQVLAGIHAKLKLNEFRPFEQDYIYRDHYGTMPSQPRTFKVDGIEMTSRILHQTGIGLRDVTGADLLYEIEDEKFCLVQYKRSYNHNVKADSKQLQTLLGNCPEKCMHNKRRPLRKEWLPIKVNSFCGSWYCVIDNNGEKRFVHGCEAEAIFQRNQSVHDKEFHFGISESTYLELFSSCRIGALVRVPLDKKVKTGYVENLLESNHLIFEIVQKGKWSTN